MKLTFAPMEGITYSSYRRIHAEMFPGADRYYSPFLSPNGSGAVKTGLLKELMPERNAGLDLVPQILCNSAEPFLLCAERLEGMGYREVNLNIGCPSGTVVAKHKGAGMLSDRESLKKTLDGIFSRCPVEVSVKTRMGLRSTDEFPEILDLYREYPLKSLTIHARARDGMYKSLPDIAGFSSAAKSCPFPVVYNGNIFSKSDYDALVSECPGISGVMIGRGAVANPALFRIIRGGGALTAAELMEFHDSLTDAYLSEGLPEQYCAARMKELWFYMLDMFPGAERTGKAILRSRSMSEYRSAVSQLFSSARFDGSAAFCR